MLLWSMDGNNSTGKPNKISINSDKIESKDTMLSVFEELEAGRVMDA